MTVGELVARFVEAQGVKAAFGVISIHNMPILDGFNTFGAVRFVPARGEAGAANMADAYARVTGGLGVCVTSTGTGAGNAAGALIEAMTAGTPMLHLTGQIDSPYLDKDWGFIHENSGQMRMLEGAGKAAFRIRDAQLALGVLHEAARLARTPPCGPVSVEIPIDVQMQIVPESAEISGAETEAKSTTLSLALPPGGRGLTALVEKLRTAKRPLLWCGGGARGAADAVLRLVNLGFGVVTSANGRGVLPETHAASLGAFNVLPSAEALYAQCDAMLVVGSRLRSNETLGYKLKLPANLHRVDANPLANGRAYPTASFIHADARATLHALADALEQSAPKVQTDANWHHTIATARAEAEAKVTHDAGAYAALKHAVNAVAQGKLWWVRDITLSNTIWGNRCVAFADPRTGVHALGGGIGQALAMGIGAAVADETHDLQRTTVALIGDGGFMLNVGELACAVQENANLLILLMNDRGYGVIKNIQDAVYGGRRCYVDLHTPDFAQLAASMGAAHVVVREPRTIETVLRAQWQKSGVRLVEIDMNAWGPFNAKPAGPPRRV